MQGEAPMDRRRCGEGQPVLILAGLPTRLSALGLLAMVIQVFVYPGDKRYVALPCVMRLPANGVCAFERL